MRRADRLFEIIQILRRRKLVRARELAEALEVSERTVYRDIRDLMTSGVPIEGEAGVGYVLRGGFDLPPLMFGEQEIEALVLGARIIESWADQELAEAAGNVIAKVEAVIPERLRDHMAQTALLAPSRHFSEPISVDPSVLRRALRQRYKLQFAYSDEERRPFGCSPPGASCARTSAPSGSTGSPSWKCSTSASAPSPARRSTTCSQEITLRAVTLLTSCCQQVGPIVPSTHLEVSDGPG